MILVFAGKRVGEDLLSYLISRGDPVGYVVVASPADYRISELCLQKNIPFANFADFKLESSFHEPGAFEWLLDLWSPHILSKDVLSLAKTRANLHPSFVPHARGADSTAWCIRNGLPVGVSILEMTEVVDGGGLYAQKQVHTEFPISGKVLHERLQDEMIDFFKEVWPRMLSGAVTAGPQPQGGSYFRRKDTNADRAKRSDEVMTLGDAVRWIMAHDFHPGTTAELEENGSRYKLQLAVTKIV